MAKRTIIIGNARCNSVGYKSRDGLATSTGLGYADYAAVALVFSKDMNRGESPGHIEFKFEMGSALKALDPEFTVGSSQNVGGATRLTAKGPFGTLGGIQMQREVSPTVDFRPFLDCYIGVKKQRPLFLDGGPSSNMLTSLQYHKVIRPTTEDLYVRGEDISNYSNDPDTFRFYVPDAPLSLHSCKDLSKRFERMKKLESAQPKKVIGALVLGSCNRSELSSHSNINSTPIIDNFPDIPVGGMLCNTVLGRTTCPDNLTTCFTHIYSTMYLLMIYSPDKY